MATLTLSPDWSVSKTTKLSAEFSDRLGDGYSQHIGVTAYRSVWQVAKVFPAARQAEAIAAYNLLMLNQGDVEFQWSPGLGIPAIDFYSQEWSIAELGEPRPGEKTYKITGVFEEKTPSGISLGDAVAEPSGYPILPLKKDWALQRNESAEITRIQYKGGVVDRDRYSVINPISEKIQITGKTADLATLDNFLRNRGGKPFRLEDNQELWRCTEWTFQALGVANDCRGALWQFSGEVSRVYRGLNNRDDIAPTATLLTVPLVTGGTSTNIQIQYFDAVGIDQATLGTGDIRVFGPSSVQDPLFISYANGIATYQVQAPGGSWDAADNGFYSVAMQPDQVFDTSGNPVSAAFLNGYLGAFRVQAGTVATDTTRPTAALVSAQDITTVHGSSIIRVQFSDNEALDESTIGGAEIRVTDGVNTYVPGFVSQSSGLATYQLNPPNVLGWDESANGSYSINVVAGAVADVAGNEILAATIGSISIGADTTAPTATMAAIADITGPAQTISIQITYADAGSGVNRNAIATGNIEVRRVIDDTFFALPVFSVYDSGTGVATYQITPPLGEWSGGDSGDYYVVLLANQIEDNAGNVTLSQTLGGFTIDIQALGMVPILTAAII